MADGALAGLSWSRVDASGSLPAHSMRRGGQWLTLARAEVGERVRDAAQALPALGGKRGEAAALSARNRAERVWADCTTRLAGPLTAFTHSTSSRSTACGARRGAARGGAHMEESLWLPMSC